MSDVVIEELILPDTVGGEGWDAFEELIAVRNRVESEILGTDAVSVTAEGVLPYFGDNPHRRRRHFTVRLDGDMVARAILGWPTAEGAKEARINVDVLPEHRRQGIGSALLERLESIAGELGRDVMQTDQMHTTTPGGRRIESPTGFGDLPADDPGASFLMAHGYTLEMVVRISSLDPLAARETVESQLKLAEEHAGTDYRVVTWTGPTPDAWLEDMAVLKTGMTTDAPMAGMEMAPDPWDAQRVREHGVRQQATGRALLTAAAEHVPTGRLVAFTEIQVDPGPAPFAVQEDTLVLRAYRGHRLGLLLKAANIRHLRDVSPDATVITTFNAEDNRPMLDVNEALGFTPIGAEGEWQKRV